jgi:hypothetical protein
MFGADITMKYPVLYRDDMSTPTQYEGRNAKDSLTLYKNRAISVL